ncbi:unnamed protein product [Periconia digitata]|uniref:Uncharacterized protein n=1 Tax=Periconia digitata TaxID=1303443 RepID=A0A9W4XS31_9PLEO|nr:unnamed protein product [Periconia digitata]
MLFTSIAPLLLLAAKASAAGCKGTYTYGFCEPDRIVRYYDPEDGMICSMRDCGGGRAPPKTTDPCCNAYKGTETCDPNPPPTYLPCFSQLQASTAGTLRSSAPEVTPTASASATATVTSSSSSTDLSALSPSATPPLAGLPTISGLGSVRPTITNAPSVNGTITTGGPSGASGSQSSSAPAEQTSNAAYALRYDLVGAIAGFVGANMVALA